MFKNPNPKKKDCRPDSSDEDHRDLDLNGEVCRDGKDWAATVFERIYRKFRMPIMKYVSRTVKDENIAEELTQEIFLKAFRFKESYQNKFRISTWLWSIARNTVLDWKRKNRNSVPIVYPHAHEFSFDIEQAADLDTCVERDMLAKENRESLLALTESLTEMQRRVLFMRVIEQLTYVEISKKLNLTLSAVKCLFFRAKAALTSSNAADIDSFEPGLKFDLGLLTGDPSDYSFLQHTD